MLTASDTQSRGATGPCGGVSRGGFSLATGRRDCPVVFIQQMFAEWMGCVELAGRVRLQQQVQAARRQSMTEGRAPGGGLRGAASARWAELSLSGQTREM